MFWKHNCFWIGKPYAHTSFLVLANQKINKFVESTSLHEKNYTNIIPNRSFLHINTFIYNYFYIQWVLQKYFSKNLYTDDAFTSRLPYTQTLFQAKILLNKKKYRTRRSFRTQKIVYFFDKFTYITPFLVQTIQVFLYIQVSL